MKIGGVLLVVSLLAACGPGAGGSQPPPESATLPAEHCAQRFDDVVVAPFENKSGQEIDLNGGSDLLLTAATQTGCVKALERERFNDLTKEMDMCAEDNPNRKYMNCETVAQPGQVRGAKYQLFGTLDFAGKLSAAKLQAKLPGLGGLQLGREYVALLMTFRVVETATSKVVQTTEGHAHVSATEAGLSLEQGAFSFKAEIESRRPLGMALHEMLRGVAQRLVTPQTAEQG